MFRIEGRIILNARGLIPAAGGSRTTVTVAFRHEDSDGIYIETSLSQAVVLRAYLAEAINEAERLRRKAHENRLPDVHSVWSAAN